MITNMPVEISLLNGLSINLGFQIQYGLFSGFLTGLGETEERSVDLNKKLFHRLVDHATVYPDGRVIFTFRNGAEVSTEI